MATTLPSIAAFLTHPVQYYSPWFTELSKYVDLKVHYALKDTSQDQAQAGFGVSFDWDIDLHAGYDYEYLENVAMPPRLAGFSGCDVPDAGLAIDRCNPAGILIFGWHKKYYWQVLLAARQRNIPVFIRVDSQLPISGARLKQCLKYLPYRLVLPRLAHYLVPGERATQYLEHYGVSSQRIHQVPHMVDVARFHDSACQADVAALRQEQATGESQIVLLFVGKLIKKKHPVAIINALGQCEPRERDRFVVWYAGSGELEDDIKDAAARHRISIRMLGFRNQSELPMIYAAADCLVLPSDAGETWGLVVNEAFACGTPAVVSSEVGGGPDLIEEGVTGWRFTFSEEKALSQRLVGLTREKLLAMAEATVRKSDTFTYQQGSQRLLRAMEGVIAGMGKEFRFEAGKNDHV